MADSYRGLELPLEPGELCNVVFVVDAVAAVGVVFVIGSLEEVIAGDGVRYEASLTCVDSILSRPCQGLRSKAGGTRAETFPLSLSLEC